MAQILLYGGSFGPPHLAHVLLPKQIMEQIGFTKVLYIPAAQSPLKEAQPASSHHRLAMLKLALQSCSWASISTIELERGHTSYTIDTIEKLQNDKDEMRLLIGADQWDQFEQWHRFKDIAALVPPIVVPRDGFPDKIRQNVSVEQMPETSTYIRERIKEGRTIDKMVHPNVLKYIKEHNLYHT